MLFRSPERGEPCHVECSSGGSTVNDTIAAKHDQSKRDGKSTPKDTQRQTEELGVQRTSQGSGDFSGQSGEPSAESGEISSESANEESDDASDTELV